MKIGFIGGGNMGGAILAGYGSADPDNEAKIALFDKSEDVCAKTRERFPKMTIYSSGRELCSSSDVVILGVKPQVIEGVLSEIAGACTRRSWRSTWEQRYRSSGSCLIRRPRWGKR